MDGQREGDRAFGGLRVAAGETELLLEVGGFDVDEGVEMTMIQVHINVQKCSCQVRLKYHFETSLWFRKGSGNKTSCEKDHS